MTQLKYLSGYPEDVKSQVQSLITNQKLGDFLLNKYPVKYYDASFKKYGLGATEVYVFQNSVV